MSKLYKVLDKINNSSDISNLSISELELLADEVRHFMINSVSQTGGHLGSGLGVVELTVALHKVFTTPHDKIVWDVGHQGYPHKILTGRKNKMHTIRKGGGLSGFLKRTESVDDCFGAGHSSTSISAGLGFAVARDLRNENYNVISVIGDSAMSGGMAFEAMNNAGQLRNRLIVILNDNNMSIAPSVGAISNYFSKLLSSRAWLKARGMAKEFTNNFPSKISNLAGKIEEYTRGIITGGTLFEELGFYYVGPIDGHNIADLIKVLENVRDIDEDRPVLIHIVTKKGKGYNPAENSDDKYHGVSQFCIETGKQNKKKSNIATYTQVFGESLSYYAEKDPDIVAITAAMPSGTGVDILANKYPDRVYDVAISEQHAVTFAAGLSCMGIKPFVAIYSTFLQRGYDQIIHDVAIQNLPVRFAIDRAGLVGADGATHAGMFDISYLCLLPNMVVMACADESELSRMVATAVLHDSSPIAFRYPRGEGVGVDWSVNMEPIEIGKGRIIKQGEEIAIISYGTRLKEALIVRDILEVKYGKVITVIDARFAKPIDEQLITETFIKHKYIITLEEGVKGGFSSQVLYFAVENNLLDGKKLLPLTLPDIFQDHNDVDLQYKEAGLDVDSILHKILQLIK